MARPIVLILLTSLALPACMALTAGRSSPDVAEVLSQIAPGERCRVTLQSSEPTGSRVTYEGIVADEAAKGGSGDTLTLGDAKIIATSRSAPELKTNIPLIDRSFSSVCVVEQSLDAPVTIPIAKIEQVTRISDDPSPREEPGESSRVSRKAAR